MLPGVGVWMLGKKELAKFHIVGYFLSVLLILSAGFGLTGVIYNILVIIGALGWLLIYLWSNYTVFVMINKTYNK